MKSMRTLVVTAAVLSVGVCARCAGRCRPWLVQGALDRAGVSISLTLGNACTPENAGFYFMHYRTRDAAGQRGFSFQSADYPEQQAPLDLALKSMALLGATDQDIEFLEGTVMPLVAAGRAAEAGEAWRGYLVARGSGARP
ncbi:MAG: hypothetical protein NTY77_06530 [Elusimicrobia bacterium]|nr:hypothetical protein [Elusimicrobiota bacterium]